MFDRVLFHGVHALVHIADIVIDEGSSQTKGSQTQLLRSKIRHGV